jgi:uncharacterized coiled-coil protein SlyX
MGNTRIILLTLAFCALVVTAVGAYRESPSSRPEPGGQDALQLDRRISALEQRLYTIESRISGIEQQVIQSRPSTPSGAVRDPLVDQLRSEMSLLRERVRELECEMVKVDERTLSEAAKKNRAGAKDPCRQNPQSPVRLTTRQ